MELKIGLSTKQIEFRQSLHKFGVTGFGGAKGGAKSGGARHVGLLECLETPGLVVGLFRKTYSELQDNHLDPLFRAYPALRPYYNGGEHTLRIPSLQSEFKFRYCASLSDVDKQAGREYHRLLIEEAGDWEYEMVMRLIRNTNRSSVPGVTPSAAVLFNWGGIGHGFLKRIFIDKQLRPNEKNLTWNFILAKVEDNPWIMENDPGYLDRLEAEPNEALRRAHRHGDANIVAGQFFTELRSDIHQIEPFEIPPYWRFGGAYDYGFNHPMSFGLWANDEDGNSYCVREVYEAGLYLEHQAMKIKEACKPLGIKVPTLEAGHDCWAIKKAGDPTIAEDFVRHGIILKRANISRKLGAKQCREYFRYEGEPPNIKKKPRAYFFKGYTDKTFNCFQRMIHDPNDLEDVLKVDSTGGDADAGDDGYDQGRYYLASRPAIAIKVDNVNLDGYRKNRRSQRPSWQTV